MGSAHTHDEMATEQIHGFLVQLVLRHADLEMLLISDVCFLAPGWLPDSHVTMRYSPTLTVLNCGP